MSLIVLLRKSAEYCCIYSQKSAIKLAYNLPIQAVRLSVTVLRSPEVLGDLGQSFIRSDILPLLHSSFDFIRSPSLQHHHRFSIRVFLTLPDLQPDVEDQQFRCKSTLIRQRHMTARCPPEAVSSLITFYASPNARWAKLVEPQSELID
jgi:hypothetical protein